MKENKILQRVKGVRDFLPADKLFRDKLLDNLIEVFKIFGYNPLETPVLEYYELFANKFAQGEDSEAVQEGYKLTDRANRKLILRTEFTAPFARVIASNTNLQLPFKRYQVGKIFRDGPLKLGRYREFMQCDVDVVGVASPMIDAEIIDMMNLVFEKLNLEVNVYLNSRKLLNAMLKQAQVEEGKCQLAIIAIDKLEKIGIDGVAKELVNRGLNDDQINTIKEFLAIKGNNNNELINNLKDWLNEPECLNDIEVAINNVVYKDNVIFVPSLARGLGYYTGNIFEVFLKDKSKLASSLCGGGRYDNMIGEFIGDGQQYPAIGTSFGLDTIADALKLNNNEDDVKVVTQIYGIALKEDYLPQLTKLCRQLQKENIRIDINYNMKKFSKALTYVNNNLIPYVFILGDDEVTNNTIIVKNMKTGEQSNVLQENLIDYMKNLV